MRTRPVEPMKRSKRSLQYAGLHPRTLRAYRTALDRFLKHVQRKRLSISKPWKLDQQVAEFIDLSYQEGEPMSYSGHLLSALKRFHPALRLELPIASQYFRNWQRCYVPSRALPAHWELVEAMMGLAHAQGFHEFALLLALGFNAMLRTSEMLSLTHQHLVPHRHGKGMSLIIPGSKTSQGNPQVLLVLDAELIGYATSLRRPGERSLLWPGGPHRFRQLFAALLRRLGFAEDDYTPYSLRRGGATWFFQSSLSLDATVARGRWSCSKTAKQYIDEGTFQLAHVSFTPVQRSRIRTWRLNFLRLRQGGRKRKA